MANPNHDELGRFAAGDAVLVKWPGNPAHRGTVVGDQGKNVHVYIPKLDLDAGVERKFVTHDNSHAKALAIAKGQGIKATVSKIEKVPGTIKDAKALDKLHGGPPKTVAEAKARIKALKAQIRKVNGETKAIDNKLKAEDHAADSPYVHALERALRAKRKD